LCQAHGEAVFGAENPPWRLIDAKTRRDIVEEWLRSMTILANGAGRPLDELLAEIAVVNDVGTGQINLVSPLLPGGAHDLHENIRAQNRLSRGREGMVHAMTTQILDE
jgi:hypothetical protein